MKCKRKLSERKNFFFVDFSFYCVIIKIVQENLYFRRVYFIMLNRKFLLTAGAVVLLAACGSKSTSTSSNTNSTAANKFSIVMVTDGKLDDKSFNQSSWEAMQEWGKETGRKKGKDGYNAIESAGQSEFANNFNTAVKDKYDLIYGTGFTLLDAITKAAAENPNNHFVSIDSVIDAKYTNGASLLFAEEEAAYLAGIAAAKTTKTNHIGYIGGVENATLIHFEAGFIAGAKSVNKDIVVDTQYVGSFSDAAKGKTIANTMYASGADIIYGAAGGAGLGIFSAATDLMQADSSKSLWVVGVDLDQHEQGKYKVGGQEKSVTLTSTLKKVGEALVQFAKQTEKEGFKTGVTTYTLKNGGVDLTDGQLTDAIKADVKTAKQAIIDGKIKVPNTREDLKTFLEGLK